MYEEALRLAKKAHGDEHPSVSVTYFNIAQLHEQQGQKDQAIALYQKSLAIDRVVYGPQHQECKTTEGIIERLSS